MTTQAFPLSALASGVEWITLSGGGLYVGAGRQVNVYQRGTTTQVQVYSDPGLTIPLAQPLTTGASGAIPGYIAAEQAIDLFDVATGARAQGEPLAVADLIGTDGKIGGPGSAGVTVGVPTRGSALLAAAPPRPLNVLGVGESIMANSGAFYPTAAQGSLNSAGFMNWVNYLLGGKLNLTILAAAGAPSGPASDSTSLLHRLTTPSDSLYALALNPAPDVMILQADGGDDPSGLTGTDSYNNIVALYQQLLAAYPAAMVWGLTLPGVAITGNAARRATLNPLLRAWFASNGIRCLDFEQLYTNINTGLPPADGSNDSIHPNATGCLKYIGRQLARELAPLVPQASSLVADVINDTRVQTAQGGWGADALMLNTGTGGRDDLAGTNLAGIASNWQVNPSVSGFTYSLVPRTDGYGNWQRIQFPPGLGSAAQVQLWHTTTETLPAGAVVQAECEVRSHGNLTGLTEFGLSLMTFTSGVFGQCLVNSGTDHGPPIDPGPGVRGVMRTPPITIPAGGASNPFFQFQVNALSGSFDIARASLVRVS